MSTYADYMSTGALVLSIAALTWQVVKERLAQPRIEVETGHILTLVVDKESVEPTFPTLTDFRGVKYSFTTTVANFGQVPVTITAVGWEQTGVLGRTPFGPSEDPSSQVVGPSLPYRLQGNDCAVWTVTEAFMRRFDSEAEVRVFVEWVRPPKRRLRWVLRGHKHRSATVRAVGHRFRLPRLMGPPPKAERTWEHVFELAEQIQTSGAPPSEGDHPDDTA